MLKAKNVLPLLSAVVLVCAVAAGCGNSIQTQEDEAINLIFETDLGNDIDDALALDLLYKYVDAGKINLMGVCLNKEGTAPGEFMDIMNTWYGHPEIPIGIIHDGVFCENDAVNYAKATVSFTDEEGRPAFKRSIADHSRLPEATQLYRRLLSDAPDNSVVIASVGFSTNLARLLNTPADEYSDLTGKELVARKVKKLVTMAGDFTDLNRPEYNVIKDIPAAKEVFGQWPTPIVTSPFELGCQVKYPGESIENDFGWAGLHPLVVAYSSYLQMPYDRETWDPTAVLYALDGDKWFTVSEPGRIEIKDDGVSVFTPDPACDRSYLSVSPEQAAAIKEYFIKTITTPPANRSAKKDKAETIKEYLSTTYPASVESVKVTAGEVRIKGNTPGGMGYYLSEVTPWEDLDSKGLSDRLIPLGSSGFNKAVQRKVRRDGIEYDRSLSRWAVVKVKDDGSVELCSHARYADETVPVRSAAAMPLTGKKGLGGYRLNKFQDDIDSLGIRSVTINIHLNSLLYASKKPGTFPREYGGITYWFDSTKVANLDRTLTFCTERGVITSAITLIDLRSADPELTPVFRHPDCDGGFYSMPNMTSARGFNAYAAVLDFLADRYSTGEHGRLNNWIIHNEVDYGIGWTNMGPQPYEIYMDAYEKSMRLNYHIADRYDQNTWVLGSYTHNWTVPEDEKGFPVKTMLDDHIRYSDAEGDFRWGVAQHPYPQDLSAPEFWENDTKSTYSIDTKYLTFKNLEVIDAWIRRPEVLYQGKTKRLLYLSENGTNSRDYSEEQLTAQAAGACWAWKKLVALPGIDALQWHAWIDNRGEFGLKIGLRRYPDDETLPGGVKPVWKVWEAAGTDKEDEVFAPYLEVMGLNDWSEIFHDVE